MFKNRFSRLNTVYGKHGLVWVVIGFLAAGPSATLAQTANTGTGGSTTAPATDSKAAGSIDLSSGDRSISAGAVLGNQGSASIQVGGTQRVVTAIDKLTGAEFFAVQQVLGQTHTQSIMLNSAGVAIGGQVDLTSISSNVLKDLVVPTGVSALYNFGQSGGAGLNLTGNLINSGNFYAYSTSAGIGTASISALNIFNNQNALLTSVLPTSFGINAISGLNLSLTAIQNIVNAGTISSAGNLSATAGGSIINALPGITGSSAIMQAVQNISLQASTILNQGTIASQLATANLATANLTNSGILQALSGSVNIQNLLGNTLTVDGTLGAIQARDHVTFDTLGTVLGTDGSILQKAGLSITGQSVAAQAINFNSPDGIINVQADRLDGAVNVSAGLAYLGAAKGDLNIASMHLSGDPIFYANGGDLTLNIFGGPGGIYSTSGGDFVALAGGSVLTPGAPAGALIDASSAGKQGGKIDIQAGVAFTVTGGFNPIACDNCTPLYTVFGASGLGGDVSMANVSLLTNGNTINIASQSAGAVTGAITVGSVTASGNAASVNGGIVNISGPGNILTGNVTTTGFGAGATGGYTNIASSGGSLSAGAIATSGASGGLVNLAALTSLQAQSITSSSTAGNGGDVFLRAGNATTAGLINVSGAIQTGAQGSGNRAGEVFASTFTNVAGSSIVTADINTSGAAGASGGSVSLSSGTISAGNITANSLGAANRPSGNISLFGQNNVTALALQSNASSGDAGVISLSAGNSGVGNLSVTSITARSTGVGASGGHVVSATPGVTTIGDIDLSSAQGTGGDILVVSGTTGTSRAAAQTGLLSLGNIDTSGATRGGFVLASNLGAAGGITTGNVITSASAVNGKAGSIGMVGDGALVLGNVDARAVAAGSTTASAGDLFLSSGVIGGTGITTGQIQLDATSTGTNAGGNSYFVVNLAVGVNTGARTQSGGVAGQNFSGTPISLPIIAGNTTVTVTPGLVQNFNPGGYLSTVAGSTLTINTGGDSRLLVPLNIKGGDVSMTSITGTNNAGAPSSVIVMAAGNIANLTANTDSSSASQNGGNIALISSAGAVSSRTLNADGSTYGGNIRVLASQGYFIPNGFNWQASTTTGRGGSSILLAPGQVAGNAVSLSTPNNNTNNGFFANGQTGGLVYVQARNNIETYEFDFAANGTTGVGGNVQLRSTFGSVTLRQGSFCCTGYHNGDIVANSGSSAGGTIYVAAGQTVASAQDASMNQNNYSTSVIRADGAAGGRVTLVAGGATGIDLQRTERVDARGGASGNGGIIDMASVGSTVVREVSATGSNGGVVNFNSGSFFLTTGFGINAGGSNGVGGSLKLNVAGLTQFAGPGNNTGRVVDASGTTGGGSIQVRSGGNVLLYETTLQANTVDGVAGNISLYSNSGAISLLQGSVCCTGYFNSSLNTSSTNGTGGNITVSAFNDFNSVQDFSLNQNNYSTAQIRSSGGTSGGSIDLTSRTGALYFDRINGGDAINAVGGTNGGNVSLHAYTNIHFSSPYSNAKPGLQITGGSGVGGNLTMVTDTGYIRLGDSNNTTNNNVNVSGATAGGTINITAQTNFTSYETDLLANTVNGSGGSINITSRAGEIELFQGSFCCTGYANGDINAISTNGTGGIITLTAPVAISSKQDPSLNQNNYSTSQIAANGGTTGGSVTMSTPGAIDLSRTERVEARGTLVGSTGGSIGLQAAGNIISRSLSADAGAAGGKIAATAGASFTLTSGFNLTATANGGSGGKIDVNAATINLSQAANQSNNQVNASGSVAGGTINLLATNNFSAYETDILSTGGSGNGGTVNVSASTGSLTLFQGTTCCTTYHNGDINVSSTSATGGTINLNGATGIFSSQDASLNQNNWSTSVIQSDGAVAGGSINFSSGAQVDLSRTEGINARGVGGAGTASTGGAINISANGDVRTRWTNTDGQIGGKITVNSGSLTSYAGHAFIARGFGGAGGVINVTTSGDTQIGSPGNASGSDWSVSGTTTGGAINIQAGGAFRTYEISLQATGGTGAGGNVTVAAQGGSLTLFQGTVCCTGYRNAGIYTQSTSGAGGNITLTAAGDILSVQDAALNQNNYSTAQLLAGGATTGGNIKMTAGGQIYFDRINDTDSIAAPGGTGTGGTIDMTAAGNITFTGAYNQNLPRLNVSSTSGAGGRILATSSGGNIDISRSVNTTNNYWTASGVSGGIINLHAFGNITNWETDLLATGSTGAGGTIIATTDTGAINLMQGSFCCTGYATADLSAASGSGAGGTIVISARNGVGSFQDGSLNQNNWSVSTINVSGSSGGTLLVSTELGNIQFDRTNGVFANGTSGRAGEIVLLNFGAGTITRTGVAMSFDATSNGGGGSFAAISKGSIGLAGTNINVQGTAAGAAGGSAYLSSVGNMTAGAINAAGSAAAGGRIILTTAQPDAAATGTSLSSSSTASGTISISSLTVAGSVAGLAQAFTSGGASVSGAGGATIVTNKSVLPNATTVAGSYTLTPDILPGGGFNQLSNTGTITLSGFSAGLFPLSVSSGGANVDLGNIASNGQIFYAFSNGPLTYNSIDSSNIAGSGAPVFLASLGQTSSITGGTIDSSAFGSGATAGRERLLAWDTISANGLKAQGRGNANGGNIDLYLRNDTKVTLLGELITRSTNTGALSSTGSGSAGSINSLYGNIRTVNNLVTFDLSANLILDGTDILVDGTAGHGIRINSPGSLNLGDMVASKSIDVVAGSGTLHLNNGQSLQARDGNITLQVQQVAGGAITFGSGSSLTAVGSNNFTGSIWSVIGGIPRPPVSGSAPVSGMTYSEVNGGWLYWGPNTPTITGGNNVANADGAPIIFHAPNGSNISIADNVTFGSSAPPVILSSLDLTDSAVTSTILGWQDVGRINGYLTVNGSGLATGGSVIIAPQNIIAGGLSAMNITSGVFSEVRNVTNATPIIVKGPSPSIISGIQSLAGNGSGYLFQAGGGLQVSGTLSADNALAIQTSSIVNTGLVKTLAGTLSVTGASGLSVSGANGTFSSPGGTTLQATIGDATLAGIQTFTGGPSAVNVSSGATITVSGSAQYQSNSNFTLNTEHFVNNGTLASKNGSLFIVGTAGLQIDNGGNLQASTAGQSVNLQSTAGGINFTATTAVSGDLNLSAGAGKSFNLDGTTSVSSTGNLTMNRGTVNNFGNLNSGGQISISDAAGVNFTGTGSVTAAQGISLNSAGSDVTITQKQISGVVSGSADGQFSATTTTGGLQAGNITTNPLGPNPNGTISLVTNSGLLQLMPSAGLNAINGDVVIQNLDSASGKIRIENGASIVAGNTGANTLGGVYITVGIVGAPQAGTAPGNVNVVTSAGGQIFWGTNSIETNAPVNNVSAIGGTVLFDTQSRPADAIHLDGNVTISSAGGTPIISSLDITDPATFALLTSLQAAGRLDGKLVLSGGKPTGNVILETTSVRGFLSAINIPDGVTITHNNFRAGNVVGVQLDAMSTTKQVIINGTEEFTSTTGISAGVLTINSFNSGPFLVVGLTGHLTSDGSLAINTGSLQNSGVISAASTLNITGSGGLQFSGSGGTISASAVAIQAPGATLQFNAATQAVTGATSLIGSTVSLDSSSALNVSGATAITTSALLNAGTLGVTGGSVAIASPGTSDLIVDGGGAITSAPGISISSALGNLTVGSQSLTGPVTVQSSSAISVSAGAAFSGIGNASTLSILGSSLSTGALSVTDFESITTNTGSINNVGRIQSRTIFSATAANLSVNGGGAIQGITSLTASAASNAKIDFNGTQTFEGGPVILSTAASGATGKVSVTGGATVSASGDLSINSASLSNSGTVSSGGKLGLSSASDLSVSGTGSLSGAKGITLQSTGGNVSANQTSVLNNSTVGGTANANFTFTLTSGDLTAASITASGITLSTPGKLVLPAAASISAGTMTYRASDVTVDAALNATAGTLLVENAGGSLMLSGTGTLSSSAGTTLRASSGTLGVNSSFAVGGSLDIQANGVGGKLDIAPGVTLSSTGAVTVSTRALENDGTLSAAGNLSITSTNGLAVTGSGKLNGSSSTLNVSGGAVSFTGASQTANADFIITGSGLVSLDATSSVNSSGGNVAITATSVTNAGAINANAIGKTVLLQHVAGTDLTVGGGGSVSANSGVTITAGGNKLTLSSDLSVTGLVNASGSQIVVNSGATLSGSSSIALNTPSFANDGSVKAAGILSVSNTGLSVTGTGNLQGASIALNGGSGVMAATQGKFSGAINANGSTVTVSAQAGGLSVASASATNGSATLIAQKGDLNIVGNVSANQGDVVLRSDDSAGNIIFNSGVAVNAKSNVQASGGRVIASIGAPVTPLVQGLPPAGLTSSGTNGGHIFYGTNGIYTGASSGNQVSADGGVVIFSANNANAIQMQGGVQISANGKAATVNNLDLTNNAATTNNLVALQNGGWLLGSLTVNGSGTAIAGNLILDPVNVAAGGVSAIDIPANVTLTAANFSAATPINVTGASDVLIGGTVDFATAGSSGVISTNHQILVSGLLNSNGSLVLNTVGLNNTGNISAATTLNVASPGPLALAGNGSISATQSSFSAASGAITVNGSQTLAGALLVDASSATGSIAISAGAGFDVSGGASFITRTFSNDGLVKASGNITVGSPADLAIGGTGSLSSTSNNGTISLSATSGDLTFNSSQLFNTGAGGSGGLTVSAGGSVFVPSSISVQSTGFVTILTAALDNQGALTAKNGALTVNSGGALSVTGMTGSMTGSAGIFLNAGGGALSASQQTFNGVVAAVGAGVNIVSANSATFGSITSSGGTIQLEAKAGALNVAPGAIISGLNGDINIFNTAAAGGSITFGAGSHIDLITSSSAGGALRVIVDTNPLAVPLIAGSVPGGFTESLQNGGTVYWGPAGIVSADGTTGNTATSIGGAVVFYGHNANQIKSEGNVAFRVETPLVILNSLDLYDQNVVTNISTLQGQHKLGGVLTWNPVLMQGVGDVIITGDNVSPVGFTAVRIPVTSIVTGQNFPSSKPFLIQSTVQVAVDGKIEFTTANSNPQFNSNQGIVISGAGVLSSITDMTIRAPYIVNNGTVRADSGNIAVIGATGLTIDGAGSYITPGTTSFTATAGDLTVNDGASIAGAAILATASTLGAVRVNGGVSFAVGGNLDVNTANLINAGTLRSKNENLNITGATGISLLAPGVLSALNAGKKITVSGGTGDVNLPVSTMLSGFADIVAGGRVNVGAGATISATQDLNIKTSVVDNAGTISPTGLLNITGSGGLSIVGNGTLNTPTNISLDGGGGAVVSTGNRIQQAVNASGTAITLTTPAGDLIVGNITASGGSAQLTATTGDVHVLAARNLNVTGGDLILRSDNLASSIRIDDSASLNVTSNSSTVGGRVIFTFGAQTEPPVAGVAPVDARWSASQSKGGNIFYGAGLAFTGGAPISSANVQGGVLIFNGANPGSIKIDENVHINVTGLAPSLGNLDLNNPLIAVPIQTAQKEGRLLGFLNVNGSGQATGGNLVLLPVNYSAGGLSAVNIGSGVTVTNKGFSNTDVLSIVSPTAAVINGTFEFADAGVQAHINSNNVLQTMGSLTSAGGLTISAPGLINSGTVSVSGAAVGSRDLNLSIGTLNNSGAVSSAAGSVNVNSAGLLTIAGGGTLSAIGTGQSVSLSSSASKVLFSGSQSIVGTANVTAPQVEVQNGASLQASANLTITSPSVTNTGSISTAFGSLSVQNAGALAIGGGTGSIAGASGTAFVASGSLSINQASLGNSFTTSGSSINVTVSGSMTAGDVNATGGNASFTSNTGVLRLGSGAQVNVANGDFILQNNDIVSGSIVIGNGANVSVSSSSSITGGRMVATIGPVAQPPVAGSAPATGFSATTSAGGHIYYGPVTATTGTGTSANVAGGVLIFNNPNGARPDAITLEGNSTLAINGVAPTLSNLDLSSASVTGGILAFQNQGRIAGQLITGGSGGAVGGNVVLDPFNIAAGGVTGLNVPANVTLTGSNFTAANAITVGGASNVQVAGLVNFTGAGSTGVVSSGNSLVVSSGGQISGAGALSLNFGFISNSGLVGAANGNLTVTGNGLTLTGNGTYQASGAGAQVVFQAGSGALTVSGTTTISGAGRADAGSISVGSGRGLIATSNLSLFTGSLNNGGTIASNTGTVLVSGAAGLTITGTGSMSGAGLDLRGGTGALIANQSSFSGPINLRGSSVDISAPANLVVNDLRTTNGDATIYTTGGSIDVTAGGQLIVSNGNLTLRSDSATGQINFGKGSRVDLISAGFVGGQMNVTIGPPPATPVHGTAPPAGEWSQVLINGGDVFFNGQSVQTGGSINNKASVDGGVLSFNGLNPNSINLNGDVQFNIVTGVPILTSLDLTDKKVTDDIIGYQVSGRLSGKLIVDGAGVAQAGSTLFIVPQNLSVAGLSAVNIPTGVVVTGQNFIDLTPLAVTGSGPVVFDGQFNFATANSEGVVRTSNTVQIGSSGLVNSTGSLSLQFADLSFTGTSGLARAQNSSLSMVSNGALSIFGQGNLSSVSSVSLTAQNGAVNINGLLNVASPSTSIVSQGAGSAFNIASGASLTASSNASVSASSFNNSGSFVSTGGSINVTGNMLSLTGNGSVSANAAGQNVTFAAPGGITIGGSQTVNGNTILNTSSGVLDVGAAASLVSTGSIAVSASNVLNNGLLQSTKAGLSIVGANGLDIAGSGALSGATGVALNGGKGALVASQGTIVQDGATTPGDLTLFGSSVTVNVTGASSKGVNIAGLTTSNGGAGITVEKGILAVSNGASLTVNEGDMILRNNDLGAGSIVLGANSSFTANSSTSTGGRIVISMGAMPANSSPLNGPAPATNWNVTNLSAGGHIFYGNQTIDTSSGPANKADVAGGVLIFQGDRSNAISLGGNVSFDINGTAPTLSSLDLTSNSVSAGIVGYINEGRLIGTYNGLGNVQTLDITPFNIVNSGLTALSIPASVTMTGTGFGGNSDFRINSNSTAVINGSVTFQGSTPGKDIISNVVIQVGGSLLADKDLSINAPGLNNTGSILLSDPTSSLNLNLTVLNNQGSIQAAGITGSVSTLFNAGNIVASNSGIAFGGSTITVAGGGAMQAVNGIAIGDASTQQVSFAGSQSLNSSGALLRARTGIAVDAGAVVASNSALTVQTDNGAVSNNGTLSAASTLSFVSSIGHSITGTGSLIGASGISAIAGAASGNKTVTIAQGVINGPVSFRKFNFY